MTYTSAHKKSPGAIFDVASGGPKGVAVMDSRSQKTRPKPG